MNHIYNRIIDIFAKGDLDLRQIAIDLAKQEPVIFLELASKCARPQWAVEVREFMAAGNKVSAIKALRAAKGLGLKDAKDIVDCVHDDLYRIDRTMAPLQFARPDLGVDLTVVYHEIMG